MPNKCCVPNCRGNYARNGQRVSVFSFPSEVALKMRWVQAIKRPDFTPTQQTKVCELHFAPADIQQASTYVDSTGRKHTYKLDRPRVAPGAVPSLLPNCPSHLSGPSKRESTKSSRARKKSTAVASVPEQSILDDEQHRGVRTINDFNDIKCKGNGDYILPDDLPAFFSCQGEAPTASFVPQRQETSSSPELICSAASPVDGALDPTSLRSPGRAAEGSSDCCPVLDDWAGPHNFQVNVQFSTGCAQAKSYAYNVDQRKLYVDVMQMVPFSFGVERGHSEMRLRALPVYLDRVHLDAPVVRCPTHRDPAHVHNLHNHHCRLHVIRAQHHQAQYVQGGRQGGRLSVTVPYELPPGSSDCVAVFQFCCMNSCAGGIQRRKLGVIFTLEDTRNGAVLGRRSMEVKVCKCPRRDFRRDKDRCTADVNGPSKRQSTVVPQFDCASTNSAYMVQADDLSMFQCLISVRDSMREFRRSQTAASSPVNTPSSDVFNVPQPSAKRRKRTTIRPSPPLTVRPSPLRPSTPTTILPHYPPSAAHHNFPPTTAHPHPPSTIRLHSPRSTVRSSPPSTVRSSPSITVRSSSPPTTAHPHCPLNTAGPPPPSTVRSHSQPSTDRSPLDIVLVKQELS